MTQTDFQAPKQPNSTRPNGPEGGAAWWIENDGLLRDEGVIFGLSGLPELPSSKVEAIQAYYRARIARADATRQWLWEEKDWLERRESEKRQFMDSLGEDLGNPSTTATAGEQTPDISWPGTNIRSSSDQLSAMPFSGGPFRYIVGSVFALAICVLAFFIVREVLGERFDHPELIAAGVMLAGMFVVFAPTSLLFSNDRQHGDPPWGTELWKVRLAEFGFPIVAAAFIVIWGDRRDLMRDGTAFLFLSMLFLLGGRLLLSLVNRLGKELELVRDRRQQRRRERLRQRERENVRAELAGLQQQLAALDERIRQVPTADELQAECEHKIALFQSEYELARASLEHGFQGELAVSQAGRTEVR